MRSQEFLRIQADIKVALPNSIRALNTYIEQFCVPISKGKQSDREAWGTGSYLSLGGHIFILTNDHVAGEIKKCPLWAKLHGDEGWTYEIACEPVGQGWPLDIALLEVENSTWVTPKHTSKAIMPDMIELFHGPVQNEFLTFAGFSGARSQFAFGSLHQPGTSLTANDSILPVDDLISDRFHFGLKYNPAAEIQIEGSHGLPIPRGFSGSAVWNSRLVESRLNGVHWTPDMARVTGIVWGWPSGIGLLVATRAEFICSFLFQCSETMSERPTH